MALQKEHFQGVEAGEPEGYRRVLRLRLELLQDPAADKERRGPAERG